VDTAWVPLLRGGRHSGVLTSIAYLLRFPTNRARAHRYYNAFECSSFIPSGPLPPPSDPCSQHEDLTLRCGCDSCHESLEPMAAHWGRYAEYGFGALDESEYPDVIGTGRCEAPFENIETLLECLRLYELDPVGEELPYEGQLVSLVFRSTEEREKVAEGPRKLVDDGIESGALARCTAERMWTLLMRRSPSTSEIAQQIPELAELFRSSGYDLKELVKEIVLSPAYGRSP
ncbi:MAG: hypothetical protein AAFQ82_14745, partial [Myxococcota bacterium]